MRVVFEDLYSFLLYYEKEDACRIEIAGDRANDSSCNSSSWDIAASHGGPLVHIFHVLWMAAFATEGLILHAVMASNYL